MKKISNLLMMALLTVGMGLTSCDEQLDNAVSPGVMPDVEDNVAVTSVTLDKTELALTVGDAAVQLTATVTPDNATDADVDWSSSDVSVATVDGSGLVTAVADGTATITAKAGDKTAECKVTVSKKATAAKTLAEATSEDIGKIAGKDGKIYATKADAEAVATGNAVAMIAYVGTASDCTHGLAIALADESGEKNYGAAGTACSGKAAVTGGTWRLPSEKDWQYMFIGCGSSESYSAPTNGMSKSYSGLASKLTTAQGDALQAGYYWSSTEVNPGLNAWAVNFGGSNANYIRGYEDSEVQVRACLAF